MASLDRRPDPVGSAPTTRTTDMVGRKLIVAALLLAQAGPAAAATAQKCGGCFVNVLLNATTAGKKGVTSVVPDGGGGFIITFARPVTGCAFTATLFGGFIPAFPIILTTSTNPALIFLHSSNASGGIQPAQYSVVVTC